MSANTQAAPAPSTFGASEPSVPLVNLPGFAPAVVVPVAANSSQLSSTTAAAAAPAASSGANIDEPDTKVGSTNSTAGAAAEPPAEQTVEEIEVAAVATAAVTVTTTTTTTKSNPISANNDDPNGEEGSMISTEVASTEVAAAAAAAVITTTTTKKPKSILKGGSIAEKEEKLKKVEDITQGWYKKPGYSKTHVAMPQSKPTAAADLDDEDKKLPASVVAAPVEVVLATAEDCVLEVEVESSHVVFAGGQADDTPNLLVADKSHERRSRKVAAKSVLTSPTTRISAVADDASTSDSPKRKPAAKRKKSAQPAPAAKKAKKAKTPAAATPVSKKGKAAAAATSASKKATATATSASKKGKASASKKGKASPKTPTSATEVWSGVPTEDIGVDWTGWTKKTFERASGKTKGSKDSYWYTPVGKYKLRSHNEVKRFVKHLSDAGGDEEEAHKRFKGKA